MRQHRLTIVLMTGERFTLLPITGLLLKELRGLSFIKHGESITSQLPGIEGIPPHGDRHQRPVPLECFLAALLIQVPITHPGFGIIWVTSQDPAQQVENRSEVRFGNTPIGDSRHQNFHDRGGTLKKVTLRDNRVFHPVAGLGRPWAIDREQGQQITCQIPAAPPVRSDSQSTSWACRDVMPSTSDHLTVPVVLATAAIKIQARPPRKQAAALPSSRIGPLAG